jgi:predicted site-specific integrase-resolvase
MNENRKGLNLLITEIIAGRVNKVVISNRDRLTRFGYGYLKSLFERYNCEIIEVNLTEDKTFQDELTDDLIAIIHHFSMKFYGKRKNNVKKFENSLKNDIENSK